MSLRISGSGSGRLRNFPVSVVAALGFLWVLPSYANELVLEGGDERMALTWDALQEVAVDDMRDGGAMLLVALNEADTARFADMTERLIGQTLVVMVCGRELARPVVTERIENAAIILPLTDRAEAESYARALSGDGPCPN